GGVRPWADDATPTSFDIAQRRFELRRLGDRWEHQERGRQADREVEAPGVEQFGRWEVGDLESRTVGEQESLSSSPSLPVSRSDSLPTSKLPPLRIVGQVGQTYIVAESPDGVYLVDQHAAHERIIYERLMLIRSASAIERQGMLIPQTIEL